MSVWPWRILAACLAILYGQVDVFFGDALGWVVGVVFCSWTAEMWKLNFENWVLQRGDEET